MVGELTEEYHRLRKIEEQFKKYNYILWVRIFNGGEARYIDAHYDATIPYLLVSWRDKTNPVFLPIKTHDDLINALMTLKMGGELE